MQPRFVSHPDRTGLVVVDPVEGRRFPLYADDPVTATSVDPGVVGKPVTAAVAVETGGVSLPYVVSVIVRTGDGEWLGEVHDDETRSFPPGDYVLELGSPVKLYLRVDDGVAVDSSGRQTSLCFDGTPEVVVGARSYHERPAGTITVTDAARDVMDAVSLFGSALKTTSCERSFPTLRGHPPLVEFGEEFAVPDGIERPDTGVTVVVPADPEYVLAVAPLAYYLGADVVPGRTARLETDDGLACDLEGADRFHESVGRLLRHVFLMDCLTRTEGEYPMDVRERQVADERLDVDFAALYGESLPAQLRAYLDIPHETVADLVPTWCLVADCRPSLTHATLLPFVVDDLGLVRPIPERTTASVGGVDRRLDDFTRDAGTTGGGQEATAEDATGAPGAEPPPSGEFVELPPADAIERVWLGDGWPLNGGKFVRAGFENDLARDDDRAEDRAVEIAVVCNDREMRREYADGDLYGRRAGLPYAVSTHLDATVEGLREVLARDADFVHYVGHVEDGGFVCADGVLDPGEVSTVGARAFLVNGCRSLGLGCRLLDRGATAGIVTLSDVGNQGAIEVGRLVARLLNAGFTVGSALEIVEEYTLTGGQYVAVGNTRANVVQSESGFPNVCELRRNGEEEYSLAVTTYPTSRWAVGALFSPLLDDAESFSLGSGPLPPISGLDESAVASFLDRETVPVYYEGDLQWSPEVSL